MDPCEINWQKLREPFPPQDVEFRIQSVFERNGKKQAIVVPYIDARAVQDRLDDVVGPENWSFNWEPLMTANGTVTVAKGTLTICGVSKSDVGDAGKTEPTKASVSDALKRAGVMWGIGRYIYALDTMITGVETRGKSECIPAEDVKRLRAALAREAQAQPTAPFASDSGETGTDHQGNHKRVAASPAPKAPQAPASLGETVPDWAALLTMARELGIGEQDWRDTVRALTHKSGPGAQWTDDDRRVCHDYLLARKQDGDTSGGAPISYDLHELTPGTRAS